MYLGVSLAITVRNWLYLELGMENKGMYVHIYIYMFNQLPIHNDNNSCFTSYFIALYTTTITVAANYTTFKETMKLATFFLVLYFLAHRLAAVVVGLILRICLRKRLIPDGSFTIHFGWISYRGPFDSSQLVFANIMWRNPPIFKRTPYLLFCKRLSVSFTLWNLGKMIFYGREIIFDEIVIDGLVVYFDRQTTSSAEDSLNLWVAIGALNKESEKWFFRAFMKSILMAIKNRIQKNTSITHILKLDRIGKRRQSTSDSDSNSDNDDDDDDGKQASSRLSDDSVELGSVGGATSRIKVSDSSAALKALNTDESVYDTSSVKDAHSVKLSPCKPSETAASSSTSIRRSRNRFGMRRGGGGGAEVVVASVPVTTTPVKKQLPTVEFNHLIIYDLLAYPLEFLTETHMDQVFNKASTVRLKKFTLDRDDVTGKPKERNGPRIPLPADDFGDKFGDAFGGALVKYNTYQIASIFAHSYANRILKIKPKSERKQSRVFKDNCSTNSLASSTSTVTVVGKVIAIHDPSMSSASVK